MEAALRIVLVTVPRVSRSCEYLPDGFDLHLQHATLDHSSASERREPATVYVDGGYTRGELVPGLQLVDHGN